jgi:2-phosphosulfolactate phosphatase
MLQVLNVYALPSLVDPEELAGGTVVVIDVLRSTTSIVHALEAGAREVIPCAEIDEVRQLAAEYPPGEVVLGGERHGVKIEGFDLGNSPEEYSPRKVAGKTVIITTTNGTRAMAQAASAEKILIGAFVNVSAIQARLLGEERIHLLCSGTDGQYSEDDILLAGMLVERIQRLGGMPYLQNAQAITAREYWLHTFALPQALGAEPLEPELLAEALYDSPGGKNLAEIGLDEDILISAQIDRFQCVPELNPRTRRIRREGSESSPSP